MRKPDMRAIDALEDASEEALIEAHEELFPGELGTLAFNAIMAKFNKGIVDDHQVLTALRKACFCLECRKGDR